MGDLPSADLLDDILTRFILSAPQEHLNNFDSMMFLIEHAYWYYEDHVREKMPSLRHYSKFQDFAILMFQNCNYLSPYVNQLGSIMERWRKYKHSIPVYGAILLDKSMERVLLVRGYKSASGWGFPRGKVNQNESDADCAIREVLEETGLDIEELLNPNAFIEVWTDNKQHKLFIIPDIDPDTAKFAPKLKQEIGAYGWHYIKDLPATIDEANQVYMSSDGLRHRFFMVQPFVGKLREWIRNRKIELGLLPAKGNRKGGGKALTQQGSFQARKHSSMGDAQAAAALPSSSTAAASDAAATAAPHAPFTSAIVPGEAAYAAGSSLQQQQQQHRNSKPQAEQQHAKLQALQNLPRTVVQQDVPKLQWNELPKAAPKIPMQAVRQSEQPATQLLPSQQAAHATKHSMKNFAFDQDAILQCLTPLSA